MFTRLLTGVLIALLVCGECIPRAMAAESHDQKIKSKASVFQGRLVVVDPDKRVSKEKLNGLLKEVHDDGIVLQTVSDPDDIHLAYRDIKKIELPVVVVTTNQTHTVRGRGGSYSQRDKIEGVLAENQADYIVLTNPDGCNRRTILRTNIYKIDQPWSKLHKGLVIAAVATGMAGLIVARAVRCKPSAKTLHPCRR